MIDHYHLVSSIQIEQHRYTLGCRCSIEQFEELETIICVGKQTVECPFVSLNRNTKAVEYQVTVPELTEDKYVFWAISKDGERKGVWKPDTSLQPDTLPAGFFFPGRYLSLTYDSGRSLQARSTDPNNFYAGLTGIRKTNSNLIFSGYLFLPAEQCNVDSLNLKIIKFREEAINSSHSVNVTPPEEKVFDNYDPQLYPKYGGNKIYKFIAIIAIDKIKDHYGYFNIFLEHNNTRVSFSNFNPKLLKRDHCYHVQLPKFNKALLVPFYNEFFEKWRLDIYHINAIEWFKLGFLKIKCFVKAIDKDKKIWLIGEYNNVARDNGMHFYNYLCGKETEITAYYVIYKDAKERSNIHRTNTVFYGSYKHFEIASKAGVLVFSHMPEFLLPKIDSIVRYRKKLAEFKTVFIQHGVIATTGSVVIYKKRLRKINKFIASSLFEKNIICKYLGYDDKEVAVTGLARWDNLLAISKKSTDILIMPTWRNNLDIVSKSEFKQSNYYKFWNTLLSNVDLLNLIRTNNITVYFFLHIGFTQFAGCFQLPPEIKQANNRNIQQLLSSCGLMVTDYSSVAFDILIQDKPVIFCPFDYSEMKNLRKGPDFINYEKDLPGPICYDQDSTVQEVIKHVKKGYKIDNIYRKRRKKFFDHIDSRNCDRLYAEIKALIEM